MIGLVFGVFFIVLLVLGFPMVAAYSLSFIAPLLAGGETLYGVKDIVGWLTSAAGKTTYVAIALFVVSGNLMSEGQLTEKIFDIFAFFFGKFKACMPIAAVLTAIFYGMISGSGMAVVAAVGAMVLPFLIKLKYDRLFFASMLAAAGSLGQLIPPSSAILQYCALAGTDENQMFRVGAVVGFSCAAALIIITLLHCRKDFGDQEMIQESYQELRQRGFWNVFKVSIWGILSPAIILGGIFTEVLTVVEAAAVAVVYAAFVAVCVYKTLDLKGLWKAIVGSVKSVASVALILAFGVAFSSLMDVFNGGEIIGNAIMSVLSSPFAFILASIIMMSIGMMFMNPIAIVVPIVAPIAASFGIDPMVYGAGLAGIVAIGSLTPPFGVSLYIMAPISGVEPMKIAKKVLPFWGIMTLIITIYTLFPQLCAWAYK